MPNILTPFCAFIKFPSSTLHHLLTTEFELNWTFQNRIYSGELHKFKTQKHEPKSQISKTICPQRWMSTETYLNMLRNYFNNILKSNWIKILCTMHLSCGTPSRWIFVQSPLVKERLKFCCFFRIFSTWLPDVSIPMTNALLLGWALEHWCQIWDC